ncbi:hypothetical protein BBK36DRAFT_1129421 [Trichoderma citrinoviride]|uniref:F-box domain-containing protein n=1 Tax=Trichoderma citrinoviride TaxID=58853 RepID=A0A2T4AZ00_9HYPO|nr:hypothetical protein BBK36DRAFT_1129421 [Trichoderma citrinoviride]PTB62300.1 hypothetical protein BBK36DRAFT_1129421 [Trichoderma citrinoviride]
MSLMVGRWLRSLTSKKAEQDPSCAILQLPVEMILLIFEQLPQYQRILLAQTCSSLRAIFIDNYKAREDGGQPLSSGQLGVDQRSRFLFTMAYSQPNLLACHQCMKLHTIDQEDTPSSWWQFSCRHEEGSPMDIVRWSEEYVTLPQALRYQARRDCCRAWGPVARGLRVEIAINDAFETGEEMVGSCYGCETDFAVQASSETTVVRAWSNLGSETTFVDNQSWQSMAKFGESSRGSHSRPGCVRQLYEQGAISGHLSEE